MKAKSNLLKMVLLIDGNHLMYRAYYKFLNLKTFEGINTSIIYGFPFILESLIRRLGPDRVEAFFDGGRSSFRKELLPNYKEREHKLGFDADSFYSQKDALFESLPLMGIPVIHEKGYEADDLIAMQTRRYYKAGYEVVIVSGDKDFNQLINDRVSVWNTKSNMKYTKNTLKTFVGYTPDQTIDWLSIGGDNSDNIPGYPGVGEKTLKDFFNRFTSINEFLESGETFKKIDKDKLREVYRRNKKLISLTLFYQKFLIKKATPYINDKNPNLNELWLGRFCKKYEINTFMEPKFLSTFKNLNRNANI